MPEEKLCLEMERLPWWACIDGDSQAWSLQLILQGDANNFRSVEAFWPVPAAQEITTAMRKMWDCKTD